LRWVAGRRRTFSAYYSGRQAEKWRLGRADGGQDKPVFVYKLIARGSVEEKIQHLQ
jgi:SNF2 family DNA or RNA helicase